MAVLVIETATAACSVALIAGDRALSERHELVGRGHAERLVPMIGELLAPGGVDIEAVLVDCGPGSFTGIRVGLAAALGLGLAWGVPVRGFSSLALLAAADGGAQPIAVAINGGHGEIFVQRFSFRPLAALDAFRALTPAAAAAEIIDETVIGSSAAALIAARGTGRAIEGVPRAAAAWRLPAALRALAPVPLYGRAPDAKLPA